MLYLGTSRCETHFRPDVIDPITGMHSYNAGIIGSGFDLQRTTLEAYLASAQTPPEFVVIGIDFYDPDRQNEVNHFPRYFPYLNNRPLWAGLQRIDSRIRAFRWLAPYSLAFMNDRYRYAALRGYSGNTITYDEQFISGFVPASQLPREHFRAQRTSFQAARIEAAVAGLQSLVDYCKNQEITPILVTTPTFVAQTERVANKTEVIRAIQVVADLNGIVFMDYVDHAMSADTTMFADLTHFNLKGATYFSKVFAQDLVTQLQGL